MKNLTRILVLAISLTFASCALRPTAVNSLPTPPLAAVAQLGMADEHGAVQYFCTTWYYEYPSGVGVWLTNFHCVRGLDGQPMVDADFRISGEPAKLVSGNAIRDLAALKGPKSARALKLAAVQAQFGDAIMSVGYPGMILSVVRGVVANPAYSEDPALPGGAIWAEYDMSVYGGASGSPVMDNSGRVTGMISYGRCNPMAGFCARAGGPNLASVRAFLIGQ